MSGCECKGDGGTGFIGAVGFCTKSLPFLTYHKDMPWKSNELLGAAQKLQDIYGNADNAAAGLNVAALTTEKGATGESCDTGSCQ